MLGENQSSIDQVSNGREIRRAAILAALRADAEGVLQRMADELADLPDEKAFGQIELTLRDLSHEIATSAHQAGLDQAGKKRATKAPASPAPPAAKPTPASSDTDGATS